MQSFTEFLTESKSRPIFIAKRLCLLVENCMLGEASHSFQDLRTVNMIKTGAIRVRICDEFAKALGDLIDPIVDIAGKEEFNTRKIIEFVNIIKSSTFTKAEDFVTFFEGFDVIAERTRVIVEQKNIEINEYQKITRKIYTKRVQPYNDVVVSINHFMKTLVRTIINIETSIDVKKCESFSMISDYVIKAFQGKPQLNEITFRGIIIEGSNPRDNVLLDN